jgi:hypothetical protein
MDASASLARLGGSTPRAESPEATKPSRRRHRALKLVTRDQLDGRTSAARKFDAVAHAIAEDLGGESRLSAIQKHLVEAFAGVAVHLSDLHARMLLGEPINVCEHATAVSTMVRIAQRVGIRRLPRDVTPDPLAYARENEEVES